MRSMIRTSRASMCSIAAAACLCSTVSWAQDYPTKPVRYVIPFPAGSGNDIVGRLVADRLTQLWGQQVIVDNRVGASGTIGAAFVAKSAPDGYTLLHCNIAPNAISLSMIANIPYQHSDFAPISRIGMPPNVFVVHPSTPFKTINDLVAHAKDFVAGKDMPAGFRVLTDPGYVFTVAYGLRWDAPSETAYPATFVIDRSGIVRFAQVSRAHGGRTPVADVLNALSVLPKPGR